MALKQSISWTVQIKGDGSSTQLTLVLSSCAISFYAVNGQLLQGGFSLSATVPSDAVNLTSSTGVGVSATIGVAGTTMTITFATAPADGSLVIVYGTFIL